MAVSSTAAIIARILTEFRLSGPEEDDAHNTSAEWLFLNYARPSGEDSITTRML
jgi:hypothetical protein